MKMRTLIVSVMLTALAAAPAAAVRKNYEMTAKQEVRITGLGTVVKPPGSWEGNRMHASFSDNGGKIRMEEFTVDNDYENNFDASATTVPNCFARAVVRSRFSPTSLPVDETGTNSLAAGGAVSFGSLTGWVRSGQIWCFATLYTGTGNGVFNGIPYTYPIPPVIGTGPTFCGGCDTSAGLVHDGWGNGPPMYQSSYNLDPITFPAGSASYAVAGEIQTFSTNGGYVNGFITTMTGTETVNGVPMLLPAGVAALGASLSFLGARSLRRRRSSSEA